MAIHSAEVLSLETNGANIVLSSGQKVFNFHLSGKCFGENCPVHNPSEHAMRDWPLAFTGGHMVRIVPGVRVGRLQGIVIPQYSPEPVSVIIDPDDYAFVRSGQAIVRNSGICPSCGDEIVSTHRHDYQECSCGKNMVDGGGSYLRRTLDLIDSSIVFFAERKEEVS